MRALGGMPLLTTSACTGRDGHEYDCDAAPYFTFLPVIERLVILLRRFAHRDVPDNVAEMRALALDYADALRLVCDCPQIHLDADQRDALERLDARLERLDARTANDAEHAEVRRLAREALARLDREPS